MLFDQSKRRDLSTLLGHAAAWPRGGRQGPPLSYSPASELDRPIHVLILIPTLNVGGAEMDLVRTVPRIDRARFRVTVCTFLERGELSELMQGHGIGVIGPFSPLYYFRLRLRCLVQQLMALLRSPLKRPRQSCGNVFAASPNQYGRRWQGTSPPWASANTYRRL